MKEYRQIGQISSVFTTGIGNAKWFVSEMDSRLYEIYKASVSGIVERAHLEVRKSKHTKL